VSLSIPSDGGRYLKQLRAERQAGTLSCGQVDLKTDSTPLQHKLDHATVFRELGDVANGEDRGFVQCVDDFVKTIALRRADKQNLAVDGLLRTRDSPRRNLLVSSRFAGKRRIQSLSKWIIAEDTNGKGAVAGGRDSGGPFDESTKVVQVGGFHLILTRLLLPEYARRGEEQPQNGRNWAPQQKTAITPQSPMLLESNRCAHGYCFAALVPVPPW
jgi:hypothetical protein